MMTAEQLRASLRVDLERRNVRPVLHLIRVGEGTADPDGYRRHFGGELFDSFADHPRRKVTRTLGSRQITSSAAGAFQFLTSTWDECQQLLGLPDFSPASQDLAALFLIRRAGALPDIEAGQIDEAIAKCAGIWASLPGSPYGQPTKTRAQAIDAYIAAGGKLGPADAPAPLEPQTVVPPGPVAGSVFSIPREPEAAPATAKVNTMPIAPVIAALLPEFVAAIPKLGALFSSGSAIAERNVKAAELAVGIVTNALGAPNAQAAAELLKTDPAAVQTAQAAIRDHWADLTEAGGGGIDGASRRDAAFVASGASPLKSPAFIVSLLLLVMPFMLLADVFYGHPEAYPSELRTQIVTAILMVISGVLAFWLGSSFGSQRKDELRAPPQ